MKVFISWSVARSRAVAALLNQWLPYVMQAIRPWMSDRDIDRGALWFTEISDQLKDVSTGIVCLTGDNTNKPWILFESGALAKGLSESRVCTLLVDLEPSQVEDPLAQFNHTIPNREGMYSLVETINSRLSEPLTENRLQQIFEDYWPKFEDGLKSALEDNPLNEIAPKRRDKDILSELLETTRSVDRRLREIEENRRADGHQLKLGSSDILDVPDIHSADPIIPIALLMLEAGEPDVKILKKLANYANSTYATRVFSLVKAVHLQSEKKKLGDTTR